MTFQSIVLNFLPTNETVVVSLKYQSNIETDPLLHANRQTNPAPFRTSFPFFALRYSTLETMASRTVILLLILSAIGADAAAAGPLPPPPRHLLRSDSVRALADGDGSGGVGGEDIPTLAESRRRLQEVVISSQCLNTLAASADEKGNLGPENFYVFTDGMSNGFFSTNNMRDYAALPMQNKFAFVTLSCQCHAFGGKSNCCQGLRARIRVDGVDPTNPESMNEQLQQYVSDICSTTVDAIGEENILPPLAEAITVTTISPSGKLQPSLCPLPDSCVMCGTDQRTIARPSHPRLRFSVSNTFIISDTPTGHRGRPRSRRDRRRRIRRRA
jgi:hypothetical protein